MRFVPFVLFAACAQQPSPIVVASVEDLGKMPLPPEGVGRDGGMSGELGGRVLWTFGDTFLSQPNHLDNSTVLSATSGWSTPAAPLELVHSMAGDQPAQLIPYTADELAANQADALNGFALWPGALVPIDDTTGIVAFQHIERTNGSDFASDGIGLARIHVDDPIAERVDGLVFTDVQFIPQFVLDGHVFAWACDKVGFLDFRCKLARVEPARVADRAAWEFYDGATWQTDIATAAYVIDNTAGGPSVSFNEHLQRYLAVNCGIVSSTIILRTAAAIEGPWDDGVELAPTATGILAPTHDSDYNYICVEHPELSDASSIVISYSRPTDPFQGDVRLARITLQ
jgi:Domain of unknown function (DUF4185)